MFADAGGLVAYAGNSAERFCGIVFYVDKLLKGATPADLPVQQPTRFEIIINLKAAKANWPYDSVRLSCADARLCPGAPASINSLRVAMLIRLCLVMSLLPLAHPAGSNIFEATGHQR